MSAAGVIGKVLERCRAHFLMWCVFDGAAPSSLTNKLAAGTSPARLSPCPKGTIMPKGVSESLTVRSARTYAHLQSSARNYDAERFQYLAAQLDKAGAKIPADFARQWAKEHQRVAGQLNRLGSAQ